MLVGCGNGQAAHLQQIPPIAIEKRREPVRIEFFEELPVRREKALKRAPRALKGRCLQRGKGLRHKAGGNPGIPRERR